MKEIIHMSIDIAGALRFYKKKSMRGLFIKANGAEWTDKMVRDYLKECLVKGWKLLPVGDECDSFDHQTGCPGHKVEE